MLVAWISLIFIVFHLVPQINFLLSPPGARSPSSSLHHVPKIALGRWSSPNVQPASATERTCSYIAIHYPCNGTPAIHVHCKYLLRFHHAK